MSEELMQYYKDNTPQETIEKIRSILSKSGIILLEKSWTIPSKKYCSCVIETARLPGIATSGKGMNPLFALASAYGEYMERIQNSYLIRNNYGLMNDVTIPYHYDKKNVLGEVLVTDKKDVIKYLVADQSEDYMDEIKKHEHPCVPFYNVFEKRSDYLPIELIQYSASGNGMCAGNSAYEALNQGLCEIMERFAIREIITNELSVPTIPHEYISDDSMLETIEELNAWGFEIVIKDCSLGGQFPVLATIIVNKKNGKYRVNFGSHPNFIVALVRCLGEAFQLTDYNDVNDVTLHNFDFTDRNYDFLNENLDHHQVNDLNVYLSYRFCGSGQFSTWFFQETRQKPQIEGVFEKEFIDTKKSLYFILELLKKQNVTVFIRDVSFLKFPTYYIFIPQMSPIIPYYKKDHFLFRKFHKKVRTVLLNLNRSSEEQIQEFIEVCEKIVETIPLKKFEILYCKYLEHLLNINIDESSGRFLFLLENYHYLLALLNYRIGNYLKSHDYLLKWINQKNIEWRDKKKDIENKTHYSAVLMYLKLKSENIDDDIIFRTLKDLFSKKIADDIITALKNRTKVFQHFKLPQCGTCIECPKKSKCNYEAWKNIAIRLKNEIEQNPINQEDLSKLFIHPARV